MERLFSRKIVSCVTALFVSLFMLLCTLPARADEAPAEDKPTASLSVDVLSQYIFRGAALSKNSAVIQPSLTAGYKGFSFNMWGNWDSNDQTPGGNFNRSGFNETDYTFSYSHELVSGLTGNIGGVYYNVDNFIDTLEVYGGLSYALPFVTVGVTGYREVDRGLGWWAQLDMAHTFELPVAGMTLDLGTSFGYASFEKDLNLLNTSGDVGTYSGLHSGQVLSALHIPFCKYFSVSPKVGFAFALSHKATQFLDANSLDGQHNHVFGGINLAASF